MRGWRWIKAALSVALLCLSTHAIAAEQDKAAPAPEAARTAFVSVAGAPGDGEKALSASLVKRLAAAGIKASTEFAQGAYSIEGIVKMGDAARGRHSVRIDWTVFSPEGTTLGGVVQTRSVRKGSLDKRWGPAADAAARAAANEIIPLLRP